MKGCLTDETGNRYGKLVVVSRVENRPLKKSMYKQKYVHWLCRCDCGNEAVVCASHLRVGAVKSCGCLINKHGFSGHPLYNTWLHLVRKHYSEVCEEWRDKMTGIAQFVKDMSEGYRPRMQVMRIDPSKPYSKRNCKWLTKKDYLSSCNQPLMEDGYGI